MSSFFIYDLSTIECDVPKSSSCRIQSCDCNRTDLVFCQFILQYKILIYSTNEHYTVSRRSEHDVKLVGSQLLSIINHALFNIIYLQKSYVARAYPVRALAINEHLVHSLVVHFSNSLCCL